VLDIAKIFQSPRVRVNT